MQVSVQFLPDRRNLSKVSTERRNLLITVETCSKYLRYVYTCTVPQKLVLQKLRQQKLVLNNIILSHLFGELAGAVRSFSSWRCKLQAHQMCKKEYKNYTVPYILDSSIYGLQKLLLFHRYLIQVSTDCRNLYCFVYT